MCNSSHKQAHKSCKSNKSKHIIAVASGKGGVGKSTVSLNLSLALAKHGIKTGLLDADIYGPNIPLMLGLQDQIAEVKDTKLLPVMRHNLQIMSVAFLTHPDKALIWRGPLANKLIEQFLYDVSWDSPDILIIDLPPGTGDVPLSIIQKAKLSGSIIVTTPQEASIADVKKMINMFQTMKVNVLGLVENMKYLSCPDCSKKIDLFPLGGGSKISDILKIPTLSELPFDPRIGIKEDGQLPFYLSNANNPIKNEFDQLANKILEFLN